TPEMRAAMAAAEVGDEQSREDPTVNELQQRAAELLGQEAALFLPTATMANQIALKVLTRPGGVLFAEERTHVLIFEAGGPAVHSGLVMHGLPGVAGRLTPEQLREAVAAADDLQPAKIVVLENTHRSAGGRGSPPPALAGRRRASPPWVFRWIRRRSRRTSSASTSARSGWPPARRAPGSPTRACSWACSARVCCASPRISASRTKTSTVRSMRFRV